MSMPLVIEGNFRLSPRAGRFFRFLSGSRSEPSAKKDDPGVYAIQMYLQRCPARPILINRKQSRALKRSTPAEA
jgi:hypothetical protein